MHMPGIYAIGCDVRHIMLHVNMDLRAIGVRHLSRARQDRLDVQTCKACSVLSHLCKAELLIVMKDRLLLIWGRMVYIRGCSSPAAAAAS